MRALFLALPLCLAPIAATAQANASPEFEADINAAFVDAGPERLLMRCAALFRALGVAAGDGTDLNILATELETDMAVFATMLRQDATDEDTDIAVAAVGALIRDATTLYMQRFIDNRAAGGDMIDDIANENLIYCRGLRDRLAE
jgi:hypothetical protein